MIQCDGQQPQQHPKTIQQSRDERFRWWLVLLGLLPGCIIILCTVIKSPYVMPLDSDISETFALLSMFLCAGAPVAVAIINMIMTIRALHFNVLQFVLLAATIAANELSTYFWFTCVSNDSGTQIFGMAATLGYATVIVITTIVGNAVLQTKARQMTSGVAQ